LKIAPSSLNPISRGRRRETTKSVSDADNVRFGADANRGIAGRYAGTCGDSVGLFVDLRAACTAYLLRYLFISANLNVEQDFILAETESHWSYSETGMFFANRRIRQWASPPAEHGRTPQFST